MVCDISPRIAEVSDQGIWEAFEKEVSRRAVGWPRWTKNSLISNFWVESLHLHCKGGEDKETERKEWTAWCG